MAASDYDKISVVFYTTYYMVYTNKYNNYHYKQYELLNFRADVNHIEIIFKFDFIPDFDSFMPILLKWASTINTNILSLKCVNDCEEVWNFFTYFSFVRIGKLKLLVSDDFWNYFAEVFSEKICMEN